MRNRKLLSLAAVAGLSSILGPSALAEVDNNWVGGSGGNNWNDPANWSLGHTPTRNGADNDPATAADNEDARIDHAPPVVINADIAQPPPRDLLLGRGAGSVGVINHSAGKFENQGGNWMFLGPSGGTGTYNLADTAAVGGQFTHFGTGSGTLTSTGRIYVGGRHDETNGGTATLNINTTGTVSAGGDLVAGAGSTGVGVINLDAGTVTVGGWTLIGSDHAQNGDVRNQQGTLNMSGGTFNMADGGTRMPLGIGGATGTLNMTGGTMNLASELWVGQGTGGAGVAHPSVGTMTMTGGTINLSNWLAVAREGSQGTMTISGTATINKTGGGAITIGTNGGVALVNVNGGTIATEETSAANQDNNVIVGENGTGNGTVTQTAGLVRVGHDLVVARDANTTGVYNLQGGTLDLTAGALTKGAGNGTFNFTGGRLKDMATTNFAFTQGGGTLAPGASPGTTNFTAGYTMTAGTYEAELVGGSTTSDLIAVTGTATLAGQLDTVPLGTMTVGSTYTILTAGTLAGQFLNAPAGSFSQDGITYNISYANNAVSLTVTAVPEPTSIALLGLGAGTFLLRRRRSAATVA